MKDEYRKKDPVVVLIVVVAVIALIAVALIMTGVLN